MDREIESLIYKVLANRATDSERTLLASWRGKSPENETEFQSFKILSAPHETEEFPFDLESGRKKLMTIIQSLEIKRRNTIRLRKIASVVLFALIIIISIWNIVGELSAAPSTMHFKNASLSEVADFLTTNSNLTLSVQGSEMEDCRFDGYIVIEDDGEEVLRTLLNAMRLTYKIDSKGHFLISGKCDE